jgi:plasmid stability protein
MRTAGESVDCRKPTHEVATMATLTVRNIPEALHHALRARASRHEHSLQAEVRDILEAAALPQGRLRLGSLLADISHQARRIDPESSPLGTRERRKGGRAGSPK